MLYKKIHRQYVREFWVGRRFKCKGFGDIYRITSKPYIESGGRWICVKVMLVDKDRYDHWSMISITDWFRSHKGELCNKNEIIWLEK